MISALKREKTLEKLSKMTDQELVQLCVQYGMGMDLAEVYTPEETGYILKRVGHLLNPATEIVHVQCPLVAHVEQKNEQ